MQTTRGASLNDATESDGGAGGAGGGSERSPRPRRIGVLIVIALSALALDAVTKSIVVATLQNREPIELLGGFLTLRETRNSGAAFSIGTGYTVVFTLIATGVVVAILRTARNLRSLGWAVCLGLMLGGAVGNLSDRMLRAPAPLRGHVVDWIELPNWPVFNVADSAIVCGGVLAVILAARGLQLDGTRIGQDEDGDEAEPKKKADAGQEPESPQSSETAESSETPESHETAESSETPEASEASEAKDAAKPSDGPGGDTATAAGDKG
jgi:lipoprotein signal peptidase